MAGIGWSTVFANPLMLPASWSTLTITLSTPLPKCEDWTFFAGTWHAIPFDKWEAPVVRTQSAFLGYWRKATYELSPDNYVTHYMAKQVINRQPGGADEALEQLQGAKLGIRWGPARRRRERRREQIAGIESSIIESSIIGNYGVDLSGNTQLLLPSWALDTNLQKSAEIESQQVFPHDFDSFEQEH
ncbi:hypothetical protein BDR22DRAFT_884784 [Usnea florida]